MRLSRGVPRLLGCCALAGVLVAGIAAPVALGAGVLPNQVADAVDGISATLANSAQPLVTTVTDRDGTPIATLFDQYRLPVTADQISPAMKAAIVSIEDRRFYDEGGVDVKGMVRAALHDSSGRSTQGGSTITQQYVTDRYGHDVPVRQQACEQAVPPGLANSLRNGLSQDTVSGTSAAAAAAAGWHHADFGKTGTTQQSESVAFVGGVDDYAVSSMVFADGPHPREICPGTPVHLGDCGHSAFGGTVAAPPYFRAMSQLLGNRPDIPIPAADPAYLGARS